MPLTIVPELIARVIIEPSNCASMRKCPSIRVTGSTTIVCALNADCPRA